LVLALVAFLPAVASAKKGGPEIAITSLAHGEVITEDHALYNDLTTSLLVKGAVGGIKVPQAHIVRLQGMTVPIDDSTGELRFQAILPIGPNPPGFPAIQSWPGDWPDADSYRNPDDIYLPVTADLVNVVTQEVVARHRIVLMDVRAYPADRVNPKATDEWVPGSLRVTVAPRGFDRLSVTHTATLPLPSASEWDQKILQSKVAHRPSRSEEYGPGDLCINLTQAPEFQNTAAYYAAMALAIGLLPQYTACLNLGGGPACQAMCVKSPPDAADFDVCVETVTGTLLDVDVDEVIDAALAPQTTPSPSLASMVSLGQVRGDVRVDLSNIWIRWNGNCVGAPARKVELQWDLAKISEWATCEGISIEATSEDTVTPPPAMDDPIEFLLEAVACPVPGSTGLECVSVARDDNGSFTLSSNRLTVDALGTCGEGFIHAAVRDVVNSLYMEMEAAVEAAWHHGTDASMKEAVALDFLLSPVELGSREVSDHVLTLPISQMETEASEGLMLRYDSHVEAMPDAQKAPWLYQAIPPPLWLQPGRTPNNALYSIAYTFTPAFLNQVLRALAVTPRLNFDVTLNQFVAMTGAKPEADKALKFLSKAGMRVHFSPTLLPMTYIPIDPPPGIGSLIPLHYEGAQFLLRFYQQIAGKEITWLTVSIDFFDPAFDVSLPTDALIQSGFMEVAWRMNGWKFTLLETNLPNCALGTPCEGQVVSLLEAWLKPVLQEHVKNLLSEIPVPQFFDADGYSATPSALFEFERTLQEGAVTIFGEILN
jgi:hypothetical protein